MKTVSHPCYDAIVLGAGPAGSAAARQLALAGYSVLLIDRAAFPRDKVCGCTLNAHAVQMLHQLGLSDSLAQRARPASNLALCFRHRRVSLALHGSVTISRRELDSALANAAVAAGADFRCGCRARIISHASPDVELAESRGKRYRVRARLIIDARGLVGGGRRRIAPMPRFGAGALVDADLLAHRQEDVLLSVAEAGYAGIARLRDGRSVVAAALLPGAAGSVAGNIAALLAPAGVHREFVDAVSWQGTPAFASYAESLINGNTLAVGDAAAYVEPFTGEGIAWALESALAAAELVCDSLRKNKPSLLQQWPTVHSHLFRKRMRRCRWVAQSLRKTWLLSALAQTLPVSRLLMQKLVDEIS